MTICLFTCASFGFWVCSEGSSSSTLLGGASPKLLSLYLRRSRPSGESKPSPSPLPSQAHTLAFEHCRAHCSLPHTPPDAQSSKLRPSSIARALADAISLRQVLLVLLRLRRSPVRPDNDDDTLSRILQVTNRRPGKPRLLPLHFPSFNRLKARSELVLPLRCFETLPCPRRRHSHRRRRLTTAWTTASVTSSVPISATSLLRGHPAT